VNPSDHDLERLVREACAPVPPSEGLRARVLARAARPKKAGRILRIVLPYAAGVLTVLAAQRGFAGRDDAARGGAPASRLGVTSPETAVEPTAIGFESIADRPPPAPAPAPAPREREDDDVIVVASAPVPRIS